MEKSQQQNLHVVFLPYFVTSHIIPVVDTARLFAARGGITVTIITTPANARLFQDSVDHDIATFKSQITVLKLKFPALEVGLPEGVENMSSLTMSEIVIKLLPGIELLRKPMEQLIRDLRPDCIVSDMFYPWTVDLANELLIPRLVRGTNCFYPSVLHSLKLHTPFRNLESGSDSFLVPGLPDEISMKETQVSQHLKTRTPYGDWLEAIEESYKRSYGMIFTSYSELEPAYVNHYKQVVGIKRFWHIGLPSYFINNVLSPKKPPNTSSSLIMKWLDQQKPESVVYVAFGSMIRFPDSQLHEIALGLEESGCSFIWVVRNKLVKAGEEAWLPEGYEERLEGSKKGLIIRDWAPQGEILAHGATGAFMTHCGWNSSLEGITAGVPLLAWPLFAEQFYNEKLITQVLEIGVAVGSEHHNNGYEIKSPVIGKDKIAQAIDYLMCDSNEVQEIRRRVKEISLVTKRSQEEGGSSSTSLDCLINEIKNYRNDNCVAFGD